MKGFVFLAAKSLQAITAAVKLKDSYSLKSYTNLYSIFKKERHHFAYKVASSQSYGFSSSYVQMWELEHKEGWVPSNCGAGVDSSESLGLQDQTSQC